MNLVFNNHKGILYHKKGHNPKLLIQSGTHGDEYEVIESVTKYITKHYQSMPDFLFVPKVSPSAVFQKTRTNKAGLDINRSFFETSKDKEVQENISLVKQFRFNLTLSFHEDPEVDAFYMYNSGIILKEKLNKFNHILTTNGVKLFSGIDDPNDPILGHKIVNGYISVPADLAHNSLSSGTFWDFALVNSITKRIIIPEIPGTVSVSSKNFIVEQVFNLFF